MKAYVTIELIIKRKRAAKSNIIFRYVFDTLTTIRMAFGIMKSNAEVLFEDVCYSSFWSVKMAKMKGMRVVAMVQDIWPDNAVVSGIISKGSFLYNFFEKAVKVLCFLLQAVR